MPNYRLFLFIQALLLVSAYQTLEATALFTYGAGILVGALFQYMGLSWNVIERTLKDEHLQIFVGVVINGAIVLALQWLTKNSDIGLLWVLFLMGAVTTLITLQRKPTPTK